MLLPPHPGVVMLSSVAWQSTVMAYGVTFIERRLAPLYLTGDAIGQALARASSFIIGHIRGFATIFLGIPRKRLNSAWRGAELVEVSRPGRIFK